MQSEWSSHLWAGKTSVPRGPHVRGVQELRSRLKGFVRFASAWRGFCPLTKSKGPLFVCFICVSLFYSFLDVGLRSADSQAGLSGKGLV